MSEALIDNCAPVKRSRRTENIESATAKYASRSSEDSSDRQYAERMARAADEMFTRLVVEKIRIRV